MDITNRKGKLNRYEIDYQVVSGSYDLDNAPKEYVRRVKEQLWKHPFYLPNTKRFIRLSSFRKKTRKEQYRVTYDTHIRDRVGFFMRQENITVGTKEKIVGWGEILKYLKQEASLHR